MIQGMVMAIALWAGGAAGSLGLLALLGWLAGLVRKGERGGGLPALLGRGVLVLAAMSFGVAVVAGAMIAGPAYEQHAANKQAREAARQAKKQTAGQPENRP